MSRDGSISFTWGDDDYTFRLGIKELRELQERCDVGPGFILRRIETHAWLVDDLRETIRLGLIGGGMKAEDALRLVRKFVDERPLYESLKPAQLILMVAIYGPADEELDPPKETAAEAPNLSEESSPSPQSMEPAQPSA